MFALVCVIPQICPTPLFLTGLGFTFMYIHHLGHNPYPCMHIIGINQRLSRESFYGKEFPTKCEDLRCDYVALFSLKSSWIRVFLDSRALVGVHKSRSHLILLIKFSLTKFNQLTFWST